MNWYKLAQYESSRLRGEWWLIDGNAHYCDIDVGEWGHENFANDWINSMMNDSYFHTLKNHAEELKKMGLNDMGFTDAGEGRNNDSDSYDIKTSYNNIMDRAHDNNSTLDDIVYAEMKREFGDDAVKAIFENDRQATIHWALKKGWVRAHGNWMETWTLDRRVLKNIADGLYDAHGDSLHPDTQINIDVASNRQSFTGVPLQSIESGDVGALLGHREIKR